MDIEKQPSIVELDKALTRTRKLAGLTDEMTIADALNYCCNEVEALRQQLAKPAVELLNIERDEDMDRTYIPLPGGWEIQTKGKGSTFRIANTKPDAPRYPVIDEFLHEPLEQMARDIRAAYDASKDK